MRRINELLSDVKAMKRKIDVLQIDVQVGEFMVEVNVGDFYSIHQELAALAKGTPKARVVDALATDMRPLSTNKKVDKPTFMRIKNNFQTIIDWLGSLEAAKV